MEKLIYSLWRPNGVDVDAWSSELRGAMAKRLTDAGCRGIQVNVADTSVNSAIVRMSTFEQPIEATVSVWVDTAADTPRKGIDAILASSSQRSTGYLVTESVVITAPVTAPGIRTIGFANLAFLRQPAHLDRAEWLDRWQGQHTAVAVTTQSTFGYVQNVVTRAVTSGAPPIDAIVEELFPAEAMTDFHVFFDTGGSDDELHRRMTAMTASVANFSGDDAPLDVVPTSRYVLTSPFSS